MDDLKINPSLLSQEVNSWRDVAYLMIGDLIHLK